MKLPPREYLIGGAVLAAVLYVWMRGTKQAAQDVGAAVGGAVVDLADGLVSGTVLGGGAAVGLPVPTVDACTRAIAEYRAAPWYRQAYLSFNVSAQCTAADYLRFVATGKGPKE